MKYAILILFLLIVNSVSGQTSRIFGILKDAETNEPLAFATIKISSEDFGETAQTDFDGIFTFNGKNNMKYKISIEYVGYFSIEKTIQNKTGDTILIYLQKSTSHLSKYYFVSPKLAKKDIRNKTIKIFLPGGFVSPTLTPADSLFELKYNIKYNDFGCIRLQQDDYVGYNHIIFNYLDKKYGDLWRKEIRKDVYGLYERN